MYLFQIIINDDKDREEMQTNINKLMEWADKWQMDFNTSKSKVLHVGSTTGSSKKKPNITLIQLEM